MTIVLSLDAKQTFSASPRNGPMRERFKIHHEDHKDHKERWRPLCLFVSFVPLWRIGPPLIRWPAKETLLSIKGSPTVLRAPTTQQASKFAGALVATDPASVRLSSCRKCKRHHSRTLSLPIPTKPPVDNGMNAPRDSWMMPLPVTR